MKKLFAILLTTFIANSSFGQKKLIGLFGKCDNDWSGYICQQVIFNSDSTFQFYDLLHLRGWTISEANWQKKGDTIILNSIDKPYELKYKGLSSSDSLTIQINDKVEPLPFAVIQLDSLEFSTDFSGTIRYPRQSVDTVFISYVGLYSGQIILEHDKFLQADTLEVELNSDFYGKHYFKNEKWLIKGEKLFHTRTEDGDFDLEKYFIKGELSDLKYDKDY